MQCPPLAYLNANDGKWRYLALAAATKQRRPRGRYFPFLESLSHHPMPWLSGDTSWRVVYVQDPGAEEGCSRQVWRAVEMLGSQQRVLVHHYSALAFALLDAVSASTMCKRAQPVATKLDPSLCNAMPHGVLQLQRSCLRTFPGTVFSASCATAGWMWGTLAVVIGEVTGVSVTDQSLGWISTATALAPPAVLPLVWRQQQVTAEPMPTEGGAPGGSEAP